jgi:hypothetical protein
MSLTVPENGDIIKTVPLDKGGVMVKGLIPVVMCLLLCSCSLDHQRATKVNITGCVRSLPDSAAVSGAMLILKDSRGITRFSSIAQSNGDYSFNRFWNRENEDDLIILLIVADSDGYENGAFLSRDTLLLVENATGIDSIAFRVDFLVEMIE